VTFHREDSSTKVFNERVQYSILKEEEHLVKLSVKKEKEEARRGMKFLSNAKLMSVAILGNWSTTIISVTIFLTMFLSR
jgi:hypothetical protein